MFINTRHLIRLKPMQFLLVTCTIFFSGLVQAVASSEPALIQSRQIAAGEVPQGLSGSEWNSIQSQISAGSYLAYEHAEGGFVSANRSHGWQISYSENGTTTLVPDSRGTSAYHLSWKLNAVGYAQLKSLDHPQKISADKASVTYQWNDNLREQWINSKNHLEQWFVLQQKPAGATDGTPLTLRMTLDSDLDSAQNGNTLRFDNQAGISIIYDKLKVWDTDGRELPASMQLAGNTLSLIVDDAAATYPLTIDPTVQQAYLKASNTEAQDQFGRSVAISGDTLIVGAPFEDSNATGVDGDQSNNLANGAGAAYVFFHNGSTWSQQAYLKASNSGIGDIFGWSVAISGDTAVVGATFESSNATGVDGDQTNNSAAASGAAYVFVRNAAVWSQQAYLKASNTNMGDKFGHSVSISGDMLVVSSVDEASNATGVNGDQTDNSMILAGAAYVFVRSGAVWSQQAYLKPSSIDANDSFGHSVFVSGDTIVVGSPLEDSNATGVDGDQTDNSASQAGAVYVFVLDTGVFSQQAYLKASNTESTDLFGISVSISGDTLVVGAMQEDSNAFGVNNGDQADNSLIQSGAAYVFVRSGAAWSQQAYLKASNRGVDDNFGSSVSISGDTLAVGAYKESSNATGVNGDQSNNFAFNSGAAYVFVRNSSIWSQQDYVKASNTGVTDFFGRESGGVALSGNALVVASQGEDGNAIGVNGNQSDNSADGAGAAYVFDIAAALASYTIGGTVSGLTGNLTLQNNGVDDLVILADGSFTFATPLADGSAYAVTVSSQPLSQVCSITNGSGTLAGANISNVSVVCVTTIFITYTVGGTVSGLTGNLTLQNNGVDDLLILADGSFTFATSLADGSGYAVSVSNQPPGQVCSITNGSGTLAGANVINVSISCLAVAVFDPARSIPTLSQWGLIIMILMLMAVVWTRHYVARR